MIYDYLLKLKSFKKIINDNKIKVVNSTDNANLVSIALDFKNSDNTIFVVLPNLVLAQRYYDELINMVSEEDVLFYPADELITADILMSSGDFKFERINTILSLCDDSKKIVVTNYNGAIRYQFGKDIWEKSFINLKKNMTIQPIKLIKELEDIGYKRVYTITKTGEYAQRGSIIDVFPLNNENPIRIDFFDDDIEDIKFFDVLTQLSIEKIEGIVIYPTVEMLYSDDMLDVMLKNLDKFMENHKLSEEEKDRINTDRVSLENKENLDMLMRYVDFFDISKSTIFDFKDNKKVYLIDSKKINDAYLRMLRDINEYNSNVGGDHLLHMNYLMPHEKLLNMSNVVLNGLGDEEGISIDAYDIEPFKANQMEILKDLTSHFKEEVVICSVVDKLRLTNLCELFNENGVLYERVYDESYIKKGRINIISDYALSMNLVKDGVRIYSEKTLFEIKYETRKVKYKSIYKNTVKVSRYDELKIGDYVVHYDYGVGRYDGIVTMDSGEFLRDYIHISYAGSDSLYIPLEQIGMIQKFSNPDDKQIKLNDLSSSSWAKAKMKVRKKIHDISDELIKLYSARSEAEGFQFSPDSTMQYEMEADFPYETTPDQEKAILDVKKDMESKRPMDRLVCGDVGYGKTEVALRAAMKAVLDGKQVCVLAPTTILSRQHYYTFKNRMDKYGAHVELLNRFISLKKQREILKKVETGEVDVLIGTHRVLSDDIKYHDLGLLVVDEEQRFGVTHKEKIKKLKVNVDAITLSATPIPRTLQMSIAGIKDLSMIETPPKNRYPIQTYVLRRNDSVIRDAIIREITRGGQVFYLYNRVEDIEDVASHIKSLVPEARVCIGHGKMKKDDLENVLVSFIDKDYDVIVCTTIIETGLDMPDTNTIIIHDADLLGLSQLYQIRGRVGRSDKIAYAYLMYSPRKDLSDSAVKRLEALKEFSELGSGFKIAMRDLQIRGAGDILGCEQSGFIESVGIETYMKILEEELNASKIDLEPTPKEEDISLKEAYTSRHIDKSYIDSEDVRIEMHKRIASIRRLSELNALISELKDRFGSFDEEMSYYMYEKLFNNLCHEAGVYKIDNKEKNTITIYLSKEASKHYDGAKLFKVNIDLGNPVILRYLNNMISFSLDKTKYKKQSYFKVLDEFMERILE